MTKRGPARVASAWMTTLAAPVVWFAHFNALYGLHAFGDLPRHGVLGFEGVAWGLTVIAGLAVGVAWHVSRRSPGARNESKEGTREIASWLALLSLTGILFQGFALALTPA
jgi:hypothetical protein